MLKVAQATVWRGFFGVAAMTLTVCFVSTPIFAQTPMQLERAKADAELRKLNEEVLVTQEKLNQMEAEVAALKKDQASLSAALIQSAKTDKKLEQDIADTGERLISLLEQEDGIRVSLQSRRGALAEVLAALQRMGLNPPPAILVRPDDALASVRSAVLLGAVVPEMRQQTEELMDDLKEMERLTASITAEQQRLVTARKEQAEEHKRQELLLEEKKKLQETSTDEMLAMRKHSESLAAKATSLQELIAGLDKQMDGVRSAAEAAKRAEADRLAAGQERAEQGVADTSHLIAEGSFEKLQGQLGLPAAGKIIRKFGANDGLGGTMMGEILQTPPSATITSPSDGVVLYAGVFRSYGQLLILDAGGGYHVVMAGMGRINVSQGQFMLAGEPVGTMGEKLLASVASVNVDDSAPLLYIEFRKDGKPVDPAPWWAERLSGRT